MTRHERLEELSAIRKGLVRTMVAQTKELADLRAKWTASECDLAYWQEYARSMEAALLHRGGAHGPH